MHSTSAPVLLTPEEIAKILKISIRQFTERVSKREGFPNPIDEKVTGIKSRRWKQDDIFDWIENGN